MIDKTTDYRLWISIYAAVISTFVLLWKLFEFYHTNKGRLTLTTNVITQYITGNTHDKKTFLRTSITNTGNTKRLIQKPYVLTDLKTKDKYRNFFTPGKIINYPIKLEIGEIHEDYIGIDAITQMKKVGVTKIKIFVADTQGKKYKSKWFNINKY